jgi:formylglycine-generating enzyme required for sulfatase activity
MKKTGWKLLLLSLMLLSTTLPAIAADTSPGKPKLPAPVKPDAEPVTGMKFVFIKGGCYQMGDKLNVAKNAPLHEVCVSDFYLGKYEVTQELWTKVMGTNPSANRKAGPDVPVDGISWDNAQDFIKKLNALTGKHYRLPTEAEWEYAARSGGKDQTWAGTSDEKSLGKYAWFIKNSAQKTHKVGSKKPNDLGLYDMSGNVGEWCQDWYSASYYENSPKDNPQGPDKGEMRVMRGGSWNDGSISLRPVSRAWYPPASNSSIFGLRLALPAR